MTSSKEKTISEMIDHFNKNQEKNLNKPLKNNHRSLFIDFYFENFRKNN